MDSEGTASPLALAAARERDTTKRVVLVGFKRMGNLGLGYLAATLEGQGYDVEVIDFESDRDLVLAAILAAEPVLVGFSLIFQFYIDRYEALARHLRDWGVSCHFTIGGHYPSLSPAQTLELMPQLDSIVRFEGELTLLELVDRLSVGEDWRAIDGIFYRDEERVVENPDRPLIANLDDLPLPHRVVDTRQILGRTTTQLIASRGCARTCSFCSIHMFYRSAPGKVVRTRSPREVAREMRMLHDELGATIMLFQDDDFPIFGKVWHRWCRQLLDAIAAEDLIGRVLWKINCRADAVDPVLLAEMRDAGLYLVYMGLESGSDAGLQTLHKQCSVAQNAQAVEILKELGIHFDFGFMMLDPSSTFASIAENLAFLRTIVGDGSAPAEFCRMIPYDGTPIKDQLAREGRLRGDVLNPDYDFLDPRLEAFFREVNRALNTTGWIHGLEALAPQLKFAWSELAVMERLTPGLDDLAGYHRSLQAITAASNAVLFDVVEVLADSCQAGRSGAIDNAALARRASEFVAELLRERNGFVAANQVELLRALEADPAGVTAAA
jgi:anaerobic magnesium-protoporphyrin IX monomethyl ester cyclase